MAEEVWPLVWSPSPTPTTRLASPAGPRCCAELGWLAAATGRWSGLVKEGFLLASATKTWAGVEEGVTASLATIPSPGAWTALTHSVRFSTIRRVWWLPLPAAAGLECIWTSGAGLCLSLMFLTQWIYSIKSRLHSPSLYMQDFGWGWALRWSCALFKCWCWPHSQRAHLLRNLVIVRLKYNKEETEDCAQNLTFNLRPCKQRAAATLWWSRWSLDLVEGSNIDTLDL